MLAVALPRRVALLLLVVMLLGSVGAVRTHVAASTTPAPTYGYAGSPAPGSVQSFLDSQPGVLKGYRDGKYTAAQVIEGYAVYYSLNPHILLTLLELKAQLITNPQPADAILRRPWGSVGPDSFSAQIDWATREIRAGFGPYTQDPVVQFVDGTNATISRQQEPSVVAVQRFLAAGQTKPQWQALVDGYVPLYRSFWGDEPMAPTPTATPQAGTGFLELPWPAGTRVIHSSYFDHVYPTVDRGGDGNDFILNHLGQSNLSYNTHDGHDFYFPDEPIGTLMLAAAPGIAYAFTTRGNGVVIRHGGAYRGYETVYWHLDQFDIKFQDKIDNGVGVPIEAGEILGTSGKSGFVVGGAHLHFEVRHNGRQVDPYGWYGGGPDPCAAWSVGCEASVWLWRDSLRGSYDFTPPDAPVAAPKDEEPPIATLSVGEPAELGFHVHFDGHAVQDVGSGFPEITTARDTGLSYGTGVLGQSVTVKPGVDLTYPISGNLELDRGTISLWAEVPERYIDNGRSRHYLFAASENPGDSANGIYTNTLTLRHQFLEGESAWNFWTVDKAGLRHDLVVTDTLQPGWHHFAISWNRDDGSKALWIDGQQVAKADGAALPSAVGNRLEVGRWTAGYGEIGAALDELTVWKRPLKTDEYQTLAAKNMLARQLNISAVETPMVHSREIVLDTNAIDAQGGIVSVQLRRDNEPWGDPLPYYDSYRWTITGTEGLHTFSARFRDRADNTTEVKAEVLLAFPPTASVALQQSNAISATLALTTTGGLSPWLQQVSQSPDFAGAMWESFTPTPTWEWVAGQPRILYVRFRDTRGIITYGGMVGEDVRRMFVPFVAR